MHGATDLSPVCMGAALHFGPWVPNFGIQEYMRHIEETDTAVRMRTPLPTACCTSGEVPGHEVEIDEALAARNAYRRLPAGQSAAAR